MKGLKGSRDSTGLEGLGNEVHRRSVLADVENAVDVVEKLVSCPSSPSSPTSPALPASQAFQAFPDCLCWRGLESLGNVHRRCSTLANEENAVDMARLRSWYSLNLLHPSSPASRALPASPAAEASPYCLCSCASASPAGMQV